MLEAKGGFEDGGVVRPGLRVAVPLGCQCGIELL